MLARDKEVTHQPVMKKNLYSLLMVVLIIIVLVLLIANFYQILRTKTASKPLTPQSEEVNKQVAVPLIPLPEEAGSGVKAQITEAIITPGKEAVSVTDTPTNNNEAIPPTVISTSADQFLTEKAEIMPDAKASTQEMEAREEIPNTTNDALASRPFPAASSSEQIDVTSIHSFGSQKILNACWTPEELHGDPADKEIMAKKDDPDYSPPQRQFPHYSPKPLPTGLQGSIRTVQVSDPHKKLVALTFDLCERASEVTGYDYEIVNYLRDNEIPATFYAGGKWMRSHPKQTKQLMADPLFEIGNHTWTHGNMRVLTGQEMKEQVLWTQAQYELIREDLERELPERCPGVPASEMTRIPPIPLSLRYPYGTCSNESLNFMGNYGLPSIQWNIITADPWRKQTTDGIVKMVMQGIKPGSIIIAHANGRGWKTIEALPKFIPELRAKGYKFVTVTQLLAAGQAVEANSCFELRPGDNQHYDKEVGMGTE